MKKVRIVGRDIYKLIKFEVFEMGGLVLFIFIGVVLFLIKLEIGFVFFLFGIVGIIDDFVVLK